MRFVSISDSIDISQQITTSKAFRSEFASENPEWNEKLAEWVEQLREKKDQTATYAREIIRLKRIF